MAVCFALRLLLGISVSVNFGSSAWSLRDELPSQQFNTWIRPLQVEAEGGELRVYAPNRFVLDWVNEKYIGASARIAERAWQWPASRRFL